jgi:SAM-dependent methyltransferase
MDLFGLKRGWLRAYEQASSDRLWDSEPLHFLQDYLDLLIPLGRGGVLDLGCGEGRNLEFFAAAGLPTIGFDISSLALERAYKNARSKGIHHSALLQGDIDALPAPFLHGSVSVATCLDVFGQLADPDDVAGRIYELLAPGGLFLTNLYTTKDSTFGVGESFEHNAFVYRETLFRFFELDDVQRIFRQFELLSVDTYSWVDPPHPGYREDEHDHQSFVILAHKRS